MRNERSIWEEPGLPNVSTPFKSPPTVPQNAAGVCLRALAALRDAPAVRLLSLDLSSDAGRDRGARALAALKAATALRVLSLQLAANSVGAAGAGA